MTNEAASPSPDPVAQTLRDLFPSVVLDSSPNAAGETILTIDYTQTAAVLRQAKERPDLDFDFLRCITGVDQEQQGIELIYSLLALKTRRVLHIKALLPPVNPTVDSITPFWPAADWHEREAAEMFGITFTGHPNPKKLLLDDDMEIHPLLRAHPLAPIELKQGYQTF